MIWKPSLIFLFLSIAMLKDAMIYSQEVWLALVLATVANSIDLYSCYVAYLRQYFFVCVSVNHSLSHSKVKVEFSYIHLAFTGFISRLNQVLISVVIYKLIWVFWVTPPHTHIQSDHWKLGAVKARQFIWGLWKIWFSAQNGENADWAQRTIFITLNSDPLIGWVISRVQSYMPSGFYLFLCYLQLSISLKRLHVDSSPHFTSHLFWSLSATWPCCFFKASLAVCLS